jgi:hypothetical protein
MALNYDQVRQLALSLPGVLEGNAYGGPSLHVGRKFMGRLREDGETLVLKVDLAERERLLESEPDTFFITDHYRDHPLVLVNLLAVQRETLHRLLVGAWRMVASKRAIAAYDARA